MGAVERYLAGVINAKGDPTFRASAQGLELDRIYGDVQIFGSDEVGVLATSVRDALVAIEHLVATDKRANLAIPEFVSLASPAEQSARAAIAVMRSRMKRELRVK